MQRIRSRLGAAIACVVTMAGTSCTDGPTGVVPPAVDSTAVTTPSGDVLTGDAALDALRAMIRRAEREGRLEDVPAAARSLAATARRHAALVPQPSFLTSVDGEEITGPYDIDGTTYYESGGELFPPAGMRATILQQYTTGKLDPFYAEVGAGFQYEGGDAVQYTEWRVFNPRTSVTLRHQPRQIFGGKKNSLFDLFKFVIGHVRIYDLPACDMQLSAASSHHAWNVGWFEFSDEGTASTTGILGIKLVRTKHGFDETASALFPEPYILCPEPDADACAITDSDDGMNSDGADYAFSPTASPRLECAQGGTGVYDTEPGCTICQQWFEVDAFGRIVDEWWECHDSYDISYCEWLMS